MSSVLVLGAYGGTGRPLCRWLLEVTDADLVMAGRNRQKAEQFGRELGSAFAGRTVSAVSADASYYESLVSAFQGVDLVIDATTAIDCFSNIARAALDAQADFLDFHLDHTLIDRLDVSPDQIAQRGRTVITQGGFHPGLPAALVRYAAPRFDRMRSAVIGMAMAARIDRPETLHEIVDALADYRVDIFKDGQWKKAAASDMKRLAFGRRFGVKTCYPLHMEEMRALPDMYPLEETGVYVAGFNWFADYLVFPLAMVLLRFKIDRSLIERMLAASLNFSASGDQGVDIVLEAQGTRDGRPFACRVILEHDDAFELTAIPVVACVRQYLDGTIEPGLWMMAHAVDPDRLVDDLRDMGARIDVRTDPVPAESAPASR